MSNSQQQLTPPDYRGQSNTSYANKLKENTQIKHLPRKLAIVMPGIKEIHQDIYVMELAKFIHPKHIVHVFRKSNDRVVIFLDELQLVDKAVNDIKTLKLGELEVEIRKYVTPAKRIIIGNACPSVPNSIIERALLESGLTIVSQMNFLRAGFKDPAFAHILSSKRSVYILEQDNLQIPETLLIKHDDIVYRIFLTDDSVICKLCNKHGHSEEKCRKQTEFQPIQQTTATTLTNQQPASSEPVSSELVSSEPVSSEPVSSEPVSSEPAPSEQQTSTPNITTNATIDCTLEEDRQPQPPTPIKTPLSTVITTKRTAPSTSSIDDSNQTDSEDDLTQSEKNVNISSTKSKKKNKKAKADTPLQIPKMTAQDYLKPIEQELKNNPQMYILSYEELVDFVENVKGANDPIEVAFEYVEDLEALIETMDRLYLMLTHRTIKTRFTRFMTRAKTYLKEKYKNTRRTKVPENTEINDGTDTVEH